MRLCARYPQGFPHRLGATQQSRFAHSRLWKSAVMAQRFQACRLRQSVQGFCTELSTDFLTYGETLACAEKYSEILHEAQLLKKRPTP